ncbi:hypothetical protein SLEP1_g34154 [Rubroshorea leprosula]|uniref:BZIP domain-containing protein n=1 Tax=Rubroshorea leprosula TaxID=152421 RepID=A0AAV5KJ70_9ROSI|nr:hypothetical protein SLEP1_g34154 [Rubroshorea leprosula]
MANLGPAGFYGGNEEEMDFDQSYQYSGTGFDSMPTLDDMPYGVSPHNPTSMATQFNGQQYNQPGGSIHGIGFPDQTNISVQRTDTFDSQQHGQAAVTNYQISFSEQPSPDHTNINIRRKGKLKLSPGQQAANRKKADKEYRDRKKKRFTDMAKRLVELEKENNDLKKEIKDLNDDSQSKTEMINQLKRVIYKLKRKDKEENDFRRRLAKINDPDKFIEVGLQHYKKPTQNSFSSDEERNSKEEFLAGTEHVELDGDDSGDENDDSVKRKQHAARSARSGRSGRASRLEELDDELMETQQVALSAKKGSTTTSNHAGSWDNYPHSILECIRILESMEGISASAAMKAITKFESSDQRQIFVALKKEDWRREWVKKLEEA